MSRVAGAELQPVWCLLQTGLLEAVRTGHRSRVCCGVMVGAGVG
jgi:hypothetical protein